MSSGSRPMQADLRSPDEHLRVSDAERVRFFSEDWVTMPRRADSGSRLGPAAHRQVLALLEAGCDEAQIQARALAALAEAETAIIRRHRQRGLLVVAGCIALSLVAAVMWEGRSEPTHVLNTVLLGAIGLMLAQAIHMRGIRRRSQMLRSVEGRKDIWRRAIAQLAA